MATSPKQNPQTTSITTISETPNHPSTFAGNTKPIIHQPSTKLQGTEEKK
jgi:hypothetical protein